MRAEYIRTFLPNAVKTTATSKTALLDGAADYCRRMFLHVAAQEKEKGRLKVTNEELDGVMRKLKEDLKANLREY